MSSLLGDAMMGIVSNVKCGFGGEVVIQRVFTMWFCLRIRVLALMRGRIGLGQWWFFLWWMLVLGWLICFQKWVKGLEAAVTKYTHCGVLYLAPPISGGLHWTPGQFGGL